jgi:ABC-2 type transport system ATP-binding protein
MRASALLVLPLLLASLAPLALGPAPQGWQPGRNDYRITMADGTVIDATMVVPAGTAQDARLPAVVVIHGYGGSKDVGSATDAARRGYVGFAYSTRGFGQSTGQMDVAGPRSLQDLKDLVVWLKQNGPVDAAHVGVFGCSYGGGHALQLATMPDAGVATVVPCVPWSDLEQALRPNHAFKLSYTAGFYATGDGLVQSGCQPMCLSVGGVDLGRRALYDTYDPQVHLGFASMLTGIGQGSAEQFFRERSAVYNVQNIRIPVFIVQGLSDDLFPASQALPFFDLIPTPEKKLYLGFVGHPRASGSGPEADYVRAEAYQWFDHFLKGIGPDPVDPAHPIEVGQQPWTGATLHLARWPAPADAQRFALNGDGSLGSAGPAALGAVANDGIAGLQDDPVLPVVASVPPEVPDGTAADTLTFDTAPLAGDTELLGTPRADLQLTSTGTEYQVAAKVFDVAPDGSAQLVTRGIWDVPDNVPGIAQHVFFDLQPYRHTFPAGHRVEVRIAASDAPAYEPVRGAFVNLLALGAGGSSVLLPLCPGLCAES